MYGWGLHPTENHGCNFLSIRYGILCKHHNNVIMGSIASPITSLTIVYSTVYSDADQRKHHSSASPAFVQGIHRGPVNSPHIWPVTQKTFPFDDVIMSHMKYQLTEKYAPHFKHLIIYWQNWLSDLRPLRYLTMNHFTYNNRYKVNKVVIGHVACVCSLVLA